MYPGLIPHHPQPLIELHRSLISNYRRLARLSGINPSISDQLAQCETALNITAAEMDRIRLERREDLAEAMRGWLETKISVHEQVSFSHYASLLVLPAWAHASCYVCASLTLRILRCRRSTTFASRSTISRLPRSPTSPSPAPAFARGLTPPMDPSRIRRCPGPVSMSVTWEAVHGDERRRTSGLRTLLAVGTRCTYYSGEFDTTTGGCVYR